MGVCYLYGQTGGGGEKIKALSGTTAPDTAGENALWVQTETPVTDYVFSPVQPESAAEGTVWLRTIGEGVNFILDKKQKLRFNIESACQYVNGEWISVDISLYDGTGWEKLTSRRLYLFENGDVCTDVTGGWEIRNQSKSNAHLESDSMYIGPTDHINNLWDQNCASWIHTGKCIAIPDWVQRLYMRLDIRNILDGISWGLEKDPDGTSTKFAARGEIASADETGERTVWIDISQFRRTNLHTLGIYTWQGDVSILEIWMGE